MVFEIPAAREDILHGAHPDTTTRNFLPLPARHEWGEGWGEGHSIKVASSPQPSPPVGRRGRTSAPARRWWYPDAPFSTPDSPARLLRPSLTGTLCPHA